MTPLDIRLADAAHAVSAAVGDARLDSTDALALLSTERFLDVGRGLGELSRIVDSLGALFSTELTHRARTDAGFRRVALGGDTGGRFTSELLRELTRLDDETLRDWDRVGEAIAPRTSLQGEVLPCRHEPTAEAVLAGEVTARAAAMIVVGIGRIDGFADPVASAAIEGALLECSRSVTTRELGRLVRGLPDRFDPDGSEPRDEQLRQRAQLTLRELPNGLTRMIADLHPEAAGFVRAALDAQTAPRRQVAFREHPGEGDPLLADIRPLAQQRVDALQTMARDFLAHDTGSLAGTAVTMLVTVPLGALQTGSGIARISGVDEPLSAAAARRLAADAELIPVVLGTDSEVLDLGRGSRLFTEAQRRAMVARDGGCIWPGCDAPPSWCEAAHLTAWEARGTTDLDNGALLCAAHHRRFDHDGWRLERRADAPYLIPPPWLDPARTPRRAGRCPMPNAA